MLAIHLEDVSAGVVRHAAQFALAGAAPEAERAVGAGVVVIDTVDNGVGLLRRFDGLVACQPAPLIDAVGDENDNLAAYFAAKLLRAGQINRVIEHRATGLADGGDRTGVDPAN